MRIPDRAGFACIGIGFVLAVVGELFVHGSTALVIVVYWIGIFVGSEAFRHRLRADLEKIVGRRS